MRGVTYAKMIGAAAACCIGGPALVMWVQPDPDELFKKYNPDLQKRSLETRDQRLKDTEDFFAKLRTYSKDKRPIWVVEAEDRKKQRQAVTIEQKRQNEELERQRQQIREEQL